MSFSCGKKFCGQEKTSFKWNIAVDKNRKFVYWVLKGFYELSKV